MRLATLFPEEDDDEILGSSTQTQTQTQQQQPQNSMNIINII
jgi:hypothetical protein